YNTGVGWRNIVEQMLANATVADWYKEHGRHPVYAKNRDLDLPGYENDLTSKLPDVPGYVTSLNEQGKLKLRVVA
ncbi:MAG TPA: radical SAM protein, partial [Pseudomonadota bacterium]|nr:radical SAM protein [Pseudomonadota bacterium]